MTRRLLAAASLLLILLAVIALALTATPPRPVKIGLVAPFSGRDAPLGQQLLGAVKLALADREAARPGPARGGGPTFGFAGDGAWIGGPSRLPIELVAYDETGDAEQVARQAAKLAVDPQTVAVLGHPAPASAAAAIPVYQAAGLPAWVLAPGLGPFPDGSPIIAAGAGRSDLARSVDRFAALTQGRQIAAFLAAGIEADVGPDRLLRTIESSAEGVALVARHQPSAVVYLGGVELAAALLRDLRGATWRGPVLFVLTPGPAIDLSKLAGPDPGDAFYLGEVAPEEPVADFARRFEAATGLKPWPEARRMYRLAARLLDQIDAVVTAAAPGWWPRLPSTPVRGAVTPGDRPVPEARLGLYRVVPDQFPGPLVATVEPG